MILRMLYKGMVKVSLVSKEAVLRESLQCFHTITGFLTNVLHDFFEGIVPVGLALKNFPYYHADKTDKPHCISKTFAVKITIGDNGHENHIIETTPNDDC